MSLPLFGADDAALTRRAPPVAVARVAIPLPLSDPLDYAIPPALRQAAVPGARVLVPAGSRKLTGVVVERREDADAHAPLRRLRPIERVLDAEPALPPDLLTALLHAADDVLCPPGIALAAALPPGSSPRMTRPHVLTARGRDLLSRGVLGEHARSVLESVGAGRAIAPRARAILRAFEREGWIARETRESAPRARVHTEVWVTASPGLDFETLVRGALARAPAQARVLREIAAAGGLPLRTLARDGAAVRALETRGWLRRESRERPHDVLGRSLESAEPRPTLTEDQRAALAPIEAAIRAGESSIFLLHGVTGSGKTEIYLRAVEATLARGRQALVLVPEITLTHQILARLRGRFGDALAIQHSGLTPSERLEQWQRLRRGQTPIAVGARSALFAPVERLGLVVIDEEHDGAYKSEDGFRWHARDLARRRAEQAGCPVVLGSATPSLEMRHAADHGDVRRLELPSRVAGRPLPAVEIVDLARERASAPRGRKLILTAPLRRALTRTLDEGAQAILFLNRRGFSTRIQCFECGFAERCKHCDISLVYHAAAERLRCHYCGFELLPPATCSHCGAPDTALLGIGTERVEEEVRARFPAARVARLDRDSERRPGGTEAILRALREREIDVLVGTQMVAKGHDFPGVRLVGVVAADIGLHLPDFRAAERTFQLLTQVAGRAGRGAVPDEVVLQTFVPDHYAIRPVAQHDYESFYADEIRHREALGYPPCGALAVVLVSGPDLERVMEVAGRLARVAAEDSQTGAAPIRATTTSEGASLEVLGPAPAPLARLRDRHRVQLLLRSRDPGSLRAGARRVAAALTRLPAGVRAHVDVNPFHML